MKDKFNFNTRLLVRVGVVILLFGILFFSFMGEKVPYGNGHGWDGQLYYSMCYNSLHEITHHGYSTYYVQRFLPFAVVNTMQLIFGFGHASMYMYIAISIALFLGMVGFFKTSSLLKLSTSVEMISFSLLFYNFAILKMCGYYPFLTDPFALVVGIWIFYFFYSDQKYLMLITAFIGAFIWQSVWLPTLVLFVLPDKGFNITKSDEKLGSRITEYGKYGSIGIVLISVLYLLKIYYKRYAKMGTVDFSSIVPYYLGSTKCILFSLAIICMLYYVFWIVRPIHFNIFNLLKELWREMKWKDVIIAISLYVGLHVLIKFISDPTADVPYNFIIAFRRIMWEPLTLPLKFSETHLLYYGLTIVLVILFQKEIYSVISNKNSYGLIVAWIYIFIMGTQTESRFIINMLPFIVFTLAIVLNNHQVKKWVVTSIVTIQLLLSHLWYTINNEDMRRTIIQDDILTYLNDPIQRYFQFHGPWQNMENYYKWSLIFLLILVIAKILKKKKMIFREN